MRMRWWQSIRWRLALGSVLLSLIATTLLALTAIFAIAYYYGVDQKGRLEALAVDKAQNIGMDFVQTKNLVRSATTLINGVSGQGTSEEQQQLLIVLDRRGKLIFPRFSPIDPKNAVMNYLLRLSNPTFQNGDLSKLGQAVTKGLRGISTVDEFSRTGPFGIHQPFVVYPIYAGGSSDVGDQIGVLIVTTRSDGVPAFVATVGSTVIFSSIIVALLAALAAILFSRTITRPLIKLTDAARILGSGDYSTQVKTNAPGELGELANTFNEMAAQLSRDVEELRRQELWRRELIMSVTHDLATPLTAIAGLGESLIDGVNQSHEDYEATGRIIVRETLRLRRLVKDLHVMAKVEAGALQPQRKNIRLASLVDDVLAVLTPEFERAQIEPCNAVPYNLPLLQADPDMLTRVFSNLCDNAIRHTPVGGSVKIEAMQQGDRLAIAVTDSGEGIPPQALPHIFERFFRADSARQSTTGGSGLGLAIVRAIIDAHGGAIWAENVPGGGARIIFTLPLAPGGQGTLDPDITQPLSQKSIRSARLRKIEKK
ncbi:MAG TPA: HAMP domain-containing sensor histidine kinase [Ktedonobacteraceae bacterium]|nr:HAMP domain-containing sensor histidine kinase [Ktedonobacteraceae bacterium]